MIKQLMILDGVMAVAQFRDDGVLVEGMGMKDEGHLAGMAMIAHDYKRIVQGNADQLSMFTQVPGWTPPTGWLARGDQVTVCSVGNIVCLVDSNAADINEVMRELQDAAHW